MNTEQQGDWRKDWRNEDGTFKKGCPAGPGKPKMGPQEKKLRAFLPEEWARQLNELLPLSRPKLRAVIAYTQNDVECATDEPILRVRLAELLDSGSFADLMRVLERYMPKAEEEPQVGSGQYDALILALLGQHIPERVEA